MGIFDRFRRRGGADDAGLQALANLASAAPGTHVTAGPVPTAETGAAAPGAGAGSIVFSSGPGVHVSGQVVTGDQAEAIVHQTEVQIGIDLDGDGKLGAGPDAPPGKGPLDLLSDPGAMARMMEAGNASMRAWTATMSGDPAAGSGGVAGASGAPGGASGVRPADPVDRLERLAKLHADGALTDAEFAEQKRRILGEPG